ncbi:hypothetical protein ACFVTE_22570 [Arthrobacter sp. NPDC058097]|uniref:hypothetical protein n=1 Tax=Arthrobacter sp. NPDC058097 TaxID=3346340 RepID=UPI0036DA9382
MAIESLSEETAAPPALSSTAGPSVEVPLKAPRAYVIGMPIASAGLWMALLAPALVVLAIRSRRSPLRKPGPEH